VEELDEILVVVILIGLNKLTIFLVFPSFSLLIFSIIRCFP
jgi:hypothetical protein